MTTYTTWVVSTDGERARIFELREPADALRELAVLEEAESRDDRAPSPASKPEQRGRVEDMRMAADGKLRRLAEILGSHLERQQRQGGYDRLVMIAPHNVLPRVIGSLSATVRKVMVAELEADTIDDSITGIRSILPF